MGSEKPTKSQKEKIANHEQVLLYCQQCEMRGKHGLCSFLATCNQVCPYVARKSIPCDHFRAKRVIPHGVPATRQSVL